MLVAYIILILLFLLLSVLSFMGKLMMFIAGKNADKNAETSYVDAKNLTLDMAAGEGVLLVLE